jgi:hypothetical protein
MEVGHDQAGQAPAGQGPVDQRAPDGAGRLVVDAGVEDRPALAILEQIDVDVVQPKRQGNARPQDARRDFRDLAGRRRLRRGEGQGTFLCLGEHRLAFIASLLPQTYPGMNYFALHHCAAGTKLPCRREPWQA